MPRRAPDGKGVTEHRITFGNYERQFVTDIKNDIEKSVKLAAVTTVVVPTIAATGIIAGLGFLGYGIYRGLDGFSFGVAKKLNEEWEDFKGWINPEKEWSAEDMDKVTDSHSWMHNQQRYLWIVSGGTLGHPDWDGLQQAKEDAVTQGGGGGDF